MRRRITPEGAIQRAVMDLLRVYRVPAIRFNAGALPDRNGRPLFFARWMDGSPVSGLSDIVAFRSGRAVFIELKAARGTQRPSQIEFQRWAESAGCAYIVARSIDDVLEFLRSDK